ncbi:MAG: SDR family oxidoreductase [Mycolicibacterium sp.]|uniref:SDR family oxidoreductase n=1 Tax=Mycolicibacterium sp. TaxID=2320850 RepID=UPI003D0C3F0A
MDVLVTGCDTDLGRKVAQGFCDADHQLVLAGSRRQELEVAAKDLDVSDTQVIVFDNTDPASLASVHSRIPAHLDVIVNVPVPVASDRDPRTYTLADHAAEWRGCYDANLLSTVLTLQVLGDHLRSGGSVITVIPDAAGEGSAQAAVKAAISAWTAGVANQYGTRGITVNAVAAGRGVEPGYGGLGSNPPSVSAEIARLSLFLATPAARHITGQTLHVSHGALANFG